MPTEADYKNNINLKRSFYLTLSVIGSALLWSYFSGHPLTKGTDGKFGIKELIQNANESWAHAFDLDYGPSKPMRDELTRGISVWKDRWAEMRRSVNVEDRRATNEIDYGYDDPYGIDVGRRARRQDNRTPRYEDVGSPGPPGAPRRLVPLDPPSVPPCIFATCKTAEVSRAPAPKNAPVEPTLPKSTIVQSTESTSWLPDYSSWSVWLIAAAVALILLWWMTRSKWRALTVLIGGPIVGWMVWSYW
jgi:hypothetical protein